MILFEISYEVCNKVGGIYTVIRSKVPSIKKRVDRHILIGPWIREQKEEFIPTTPELVPPEIQKVFDILYKKGIYCTYGKWNVQGFPETILIDYVTFAQQKNEYKKKYWELFGVDSLFTGWDFEEPLCFSTAAGIFIEEFEKEKNKKIVAQFHEWLAGFGLLYLKSKESKVKTIFTTHATTLGRSLSERDIFVSSLPYDFNPDRTATDIGVIAKHTVEKACAIHANAFTTVSTITSHETESLLGKKADIITPNGLDIADFPNNKEMIARKKHARMALCNFLQQYIQLDHTESMILYTSGRPEFKNKGFNILLESLSELNTQGKQLACFFFVPWKHYEIKQIVQKRLQGEDTSEIPICTHDIDDEDQHPILRACKQLGLNNKGSVKIILYPVYLGTRSDIIFKKSYYDLISGCDLGVFASAYEPWGYTPLESIACGVPAITTDACGFGDYMKNNVTQKSKGIKSGLYVLLRKKEDPVKKITKIIIDHNKRKNKEIISKDARDLANMCDWEIFVDNYFKVY